MKFSDDIYKQGLYELVIYYAKLPNIKEKILAMPSIISPIEGLYSQLVTQDEIIPFERLDPEEKKKHLETTRGTKEQVLRQAKAIYLMDLILKNG